MKKILAFTAIRSEYDLLSNLYKLLNNDKDIELKLIVSGAHLSKSYGYSVQDIERDGLDILLKIETLIDSDTKLARLKSAALLLQNSLDLISKYNPDLIIYGGDREEVLIAATIGGYLEIPTIHFFGGDHVGDSHIDNPVRHATSKMSSVHMVSTQKHHDRLLKMGENPKRIFNIGSIALDKFLNEQIKSKEQIKKYFSITQNFSKFAILIFHPIPKERDSLHTIFKNILETLCEKQINTFVSYPNIDPGNKQIIEVIDEYKENKNFVFYKNLPRNMFISIFKQAEFIIGNSSAGIMESASVPVPAINIGIRQTEREASENVIFSKTEKSSMSEAVDKATSKEFRKIVAGVKNIYGDGKSSQRALKIIKENTFKELIFKDEDILD